MNAFANEPLLELRRAPIRAQLLEAMRDLDAALPVRVPIAIGGERLGGRPFESVDPGAPSRVVAVAQAADAKQVGAAVRAAATASASWGARPVRDRAATLVRAAGHLRARRLELAALAVRECGKPWAEADADVCEAIDFLEYYAARAVELDAGPALVQLPGERNSLCYGPRGVVGVVAPWNFPIAIPTGMVAAGLAMGNGVVLKPAEQAPACSLALVDALQAAGLPPEALALVPGGDETGKALVAHPDVSVIAFTGSCAVGLEIMRTTAVPAPEQRHLKRVVCEMGGKNAIIVDSDADLDDAVPAIVKSAFGFAGQKCSAASRVLVHEALAESLRTRLAGAVATLKVGRADAFATDVPPVIDAEAQARVREFLAHGERTGVAVASTGAAPDDGYFVPATVFAELAPDSPVIEQEIFGPVLAVETVSGVEAACDAVASSRFALTGGLFTRSPRTIDYVTRRSPVGNLYVNREITGAMVGRQPFGGNRLSGNGTKAGGPDYLLHFADPFVVTENTVRHGLVV